MKVTASQPRAELKWPVSFMVTSIIVFLLFPINILGYYVRQVLSFFSGGNFSVIVDDSVPFAVLIIIDTLIMPILAALSLICIILLFMKHKWFPTLVKSMFAAYLVLLVLDLAANNFLADYAIEDYKNAINHDILRNIVRTVLYCAVTLPFFYISKGIKEIYGRGE